MHHGILKTDRISRSPVQILAGQAAYAFLSEMFRHRKEGRI